MLPKGSEPAKLQNLGLNNLMVVGTPDPHHKLHEYMDGDDVGWPSLSRFG